MGTGDKQPVPLVAVKWLVYNSSCNADLAVLSNVSRTWRDVVAECVVDSCNGDDSQSKFENLLLPSWIKHRSRSNRSLLDNETNNDNDDETYCLAWFHPGGLQFKSLMPKNAKEALQSAKVLCRWQGYSEAADVFKPFGYSHYLLQNIIEKTESRFGSNPASSDDSSNGNGFGKAVTTAAVRGAVEALPEGYFEYLDKNNTDNDKKKILNTEKPLSKSELERLVLPKVMWKKDDDDDEVRRTADERVGRGFGIPLPFAQFLNFESSHAVRLQTPPFAKPVLTPITVFCVAIATEDGCFFSGIKEELEMGHMYPSTTNEEICDDRSPICLNAGYRNRSIPRSPRKESESKEQEQSFLDRMKGACYEPCDSGSESSSEEEVDESEKESVANAISGQLGPGRWHCYSAVFDGNKSIIRIDGEEEITTCASKIPESFRACLDGITIGSDHSFAMSLCFGQGSDGEGEGAIAELAFFKGHLPKSDMRSVESQLMKKHKIPVPSTSRMERITDDYLSRVAHKMMDQSAARADPNKPKTKTVSVPLRCLTRLRHVAWKQKDEVTGQRRMIQRIGCKIRKGSGSDW